MTFQQLLRHTAPWAVAGLLLAGCGGADEDAPAEEAAVEDDAADDETAEEPVDEDGGGDDPGDADQGVGDDAGEGNAADGTGAGAELPDLPQAYSSLLIDSEPAVEAVDGEVSLAWGPPGRNGIPFVVHNGTGGPISRLAVSGTTTDASGATLGSGSSQTVEPNLIEAGGYAFGSVYVGPNELEGVEASIEDPAIDFEEGVMEFENITALDIESIEVIEGGSFTGSVSNPHEVEVGGPIGVVVGCLDEAGTLEAIFSTYTDRDDVEAGGSSSFTIDTYGAEPDCAALMVGASGFTDF